MIVFFFFNHSKIKMPAKKQDTIFGLPEEIPANWHVFPHGYEQGKAAWNPKTAIPPTFSFH
jgi:hypothetical protein